MDRSLALEPFLLILVIAGTLLVLAGVVALVWKRRNSNGEGSEGKLKSVVEAYRAKNPAFYNVLEVYWVQGYTSQLLENEEVEEALKVLSEHTEKAAQKRKRDLGSSLIELPRNSRQRSQRVSAAMTTILRAIYLDTELKKVLPPAAEEELDKLLDSLTG